MAGAAAKNALLNEQVTFIQNDIPGFEAGMYKLEISQALTSAKGDPISEDGLDASFTFAVQGDRFAFAKPDQTLFSVFPPPDGDGAFETVLPHVVLTQSNLPWMRAPTIKQPTPTPSGDIPTWLTVLILDETDLAGIKDAALEPVTGVVGDLFPPAAYAASTLGDNYSYFEGATDTSALEPGQSPREPCYYIDLPLEMIWEIAPTLGDLALMAHVREVSLVQKPTIRGVSDKGSPVGKFSIVFGNRLPQGGQMSHAYLVSLEALQDFLPTSEDGGKPKGSKLDGKKFLRLAVLKSWKFRAVGQPATFVDDVMALNSGEVTQSGERVTTLRVLYDGTNEVVKSATEMGYVPLDTDLRTAEKTISWYRGPLAPYDVTVPGPTLPVACPDAATVFDPTTGMFDLSYAAAWTIGRQVALQDTSFSVPFYQWKKGVHQSVVTRVEGRVLGQSVAALNLEVLPDGILAEETDETPLDAVHHHMIHSLAGR